MPAWTTPLERPVWWRAISRSFSKTVTAASGLSSASRRATASPMIPAPRTPIRISFAGIGTTLRGAIDSFSVDKHGVLVAAPGSPFSAQGFSPPQGYGQLGSVFSPTSLDQLFVSDAHVASGGPAPGLVSSFSVDPDGVLTPIGSSPVGNDGRASCWVEISHDGAFLFVVNTASATVSSYGIGSDGSLAFLQSTPPGELGGGAEDARLSPDGESLWVVQAGADQVTGFSVSGGTLTPLSSASGPAGATPTGIVVT